MMRWIQYGLVFFLWCWAVCVYANPSVVLVPVKGPIGPATAEYVQDSLDAAQDWGAHLVVIKLNTPGGLLTSTRALIESITTSTVPVVTYVAPSGARATSAGTFILYASHFAAMAPGTHVGAATPVALGGASSQQSEGDQPSAMEKKVLSDSTAYIRSLAQLRGRNVEWAEQAVKEAKSLSASEALHAGVINMVAPSLTDLLQQVNGRSVEMQGKMKTISVDAQRVRTVQPTWRQQFLATITHPSVALVLLVVGLLGIYMEFSQPGLILPGVVGVIALLLSGYALHILPINYIGLALLLLGFVLWCIEVLLGSFGLLALGGTLSFVIGAVVLFDQTALGYAIPMGTLLGIGLSGAFVSMLMAWMAWSSHRRPVVMADHAVVGHTGVVVIGQGECWMKVSGEWWRIESDSKLAEGDAVKVVALNNLTLTVNKITVNEPIDCD